MPSEAPLQGPILLAVAVAYPPASRGNRQRQDRPVPLTAVTSYRAVSNALIESMAAMKNKRGTTSNLGAPVATISSEPSSQDQPPRKRHTALGPESSVQDFDREITIDTDVPIKHPQEEDDACLQRKNSQIPPHEVKTRASSMVLRPRIKAQRRSSKATPDETRGQGRKVSHATDRKYTSSWSQLQE